MLFAWSLHPVLCSNPLLPSGLSPCACAMARGSSRDELVAQNAALMGQLKAMTLVVEELRKEIALLRGDRGVGKAGGKPSDPKQPAKPEKKENQPGGEAFPSQAVPGWQEVKPKRKKKGPASSEVEEKQEMASPPTGHRLRKDDWAVPVVDSRDLCDGATGVALVNQVEGERIFCLLHKSTGNMAVITPKAVAEAEDKSREIPVKVLTSTGRLAIVKRYLTEVGEGKVKPSYEKAKVVTDSTLEMQNSTTKLVLKCVRGLCPGGIYQQFKADPRVAVDAFMKKNGAGKDVLYTYRPAVKKVKDHEWVEAILVIRRTSLDRLHKISGEDGIFLSLFRDGSPGEDQWRIVRCDAGMTLDGVLDKIRLHRGAAHGAVWGQWGLGIRIPKQDFKAKAAKLFGKATARKVQEREGQQFYEASNRPPWASFDDFTKELKTKWEWDVELARVARGWDTKTFIMRAGSPPPRDAAVIDGHWIPIQPAKDRSTNVKTFKPKPKAEQKPNRNPGPQGASKPNRPDAPHQQGARDSHKVGDDVLSSVRTMLDALWERIDERFCALEEKVDEELAEDDAENMSDSEESEDSEEEGPVKEVGAELALTLGTKRKPDDDGNKERKRLGKPS